MKFLVYTSILAILLSGCSKSSDPTAQITINSITANGGPVADAQIKLYRSIDDLYKGINQIDNTRRTDANGKITFDWNETGVIYIFVETGCMNNYSTGTEATISAGVNNVFNTIMVETGNINMKSTSVNKYKIFIDGVDRGDIIGKSSFNYKYLPAKLTTVRVLQLEGYILFPTEVTYTPTLVCGDKIDILFP